MDAARAIFLCVVLVYYTRSVCAQSSPKEHIHGTSDVKYTLCTDSLQYALFHWTSHLASAFNTQNMGCKRGAAAAQEPFFPHNKLSRFSHSVLAGPVHVSLWLLGDSAILVEVPAVSTHTPAQG